MLGPSQPLPYDANKEEMLPILNAENFLNAQTIALTSPRELFSAEFPQSSSYTVVGSDSPWLCFCSFFLAISPSSRVMSKLPLFLSLPLSNLSFSCNPNLFCFPFFPPNTWSYKLTARLLS